VIFEGHCGDSISNFGIPLNIFGTDEATHLKFGRPIVFGEYWRMDDKSRRVVCRR